MIKVWGRTTSSNVQKVMWTIAELGLQHERVNAGGAYGVVDTAQYTAMNPNQLVPTVEDDGHVLWESNSIVRYLAARYDLGKLCPENLAVRAEAERWMDWQLTTVMPNWGPMFLGLVRTAPSARDMKRINGAIKNLGATLQILDAQLQGRDYIMGDSLSIADIPLGTSMYRYYLLADDRPPMTNVDAWYARLQARPAYAEHVMVSVDGLRVTD